MVKVLHIIQCLGVGGMENRVSRLAEGLKDSGYRISVLTLRPSVGRKIEMPPEVETSFLDIPSGLHPGRIFALAYFIRKHRFDIVHTHNWSTMLYGILAAKLGGVKVVIHGEHGLNYEDLVGIPWKRLFAQRILAYFSSYVVAVHTSMANTLVKAWRLNKDKVIPIHNGVDLVRYSPKTLNNSNCFTIGTVGRLDRIKNYPCLINAFAELKKRYQKKEGLRLIIVGEGPDRLALERQSITLGLGDSIEFVGDSAKPENWYSQFSVFVNCSFSEGMSNTLLEAMAMGLPLVASEIEGNKSWLNQGNNALFFKCDSHIDLAMQLAEIFENQILGVNMGRENRIRAEKEFDNRYFLAKYLDLYERLLK